MGVGVRVEWGGYACAFCVCGGGGGRGVCASEHLNKTTRQPENADSVHMFHKTTDSQRVLTLYACLTRP